MESFSSCLLHFVACRNEPVTTCFPQAVYLAVRMAVKAAAPVKPLSSQMETFHFLLL